MTNAATTVDPTLVRHYGAEAASHAHTHAQVLFGLEGTLQMEVQGHAAYVDASCGLVVPAGVMHGYRAAPRARVLVLDLPAGPGVDRLRRFALPAGWAARPVGEGTLLTLLGDAPALAVRRRIDLDALAARIDADLARDWTVADLAAACHLSPQRLRARFAQALGLSPLAFVRARRLDAAGLLLRQGLALDAVAAQVGYASASALSHAMRRDRGTGARALRRGRALLES